MKVQIIGQDTLAAAVYQCCSKHFDTQPLDYCDADVLWFCYDTPLDKDGVPDSAWVMAQIEARLKTLPPGGAIPLMLVSSQLPVGSTARLEKNWPKLDFAHSPENLRVATAVSDFSNQPRVVVGTRHSHRRALLEALFTPFTKQIIFTDPETAEMVKHTLNTFLGLQIAYINEVAKIAKVVGADIDTITLGLRTDFRVSPKAPLRAGPAFGGGHLARDIHTLGQIALGMGIPVPIISHITESNEG
jgi:UDPglucose 6-dehydrogenase